MTLTHQQRQEIYSLAVKAVRTALQGAVQTQQLEHADVSVARVSPAPFHLDDPKRRFRIEIEITYREKAGY